MRLRLGWLIRTGLCLMLSSMACPRAQAFPYYIDFGGGLSQVQTGSPFFGDGLPSQLGYGVSAQLGFLIGLMPPTSRLGVHAGLVHKLTMASSGTSNLGLQATYPALRIEAFAIYATLGLTPLVWKSTSSESTHLAKGSLGVLVDIGYELNITPEISFLMSVGTQTVSTGGKLSPSPVLDGFIGFRLYYGAFMTKKGGGRPPFEGYRYPFGIQKQ